MGRNCELFSPSTTHLMVSRKVFLSVISSGILDRIFFSAIDFLFSSWNGSSVRLDLYSASEMNGWNGWQQ